MSARIVVSNSSSIEVHPSFTTISKMYDAILLDAYGVFWGSNATGPLPGAMEVMERLVANGKFVGILSNSNQLVSKEINKLHGHDLIQGKHFHFLITSGEVARDIFLNQKFPFETPNNKFFLFGGIHPKYSSHELLFQNSVYTETNDINEADFIYISIPHINGEDQLEQDAFKEEIEKIRKKNLPMVCSNPDQFAHEGKPPRAVVRQGSIAFLYEKMGGYVFYIGKPYENAYSMAMNEFKRYNINNPYEILMVGDTPETDIRGARRFGMASALVTQAGIMADRISHQGFENAINKLSPDDYPDYFIGRFIDVFHTSP